MPRTTAPDRGTQSRVRLAIARAAVGLFVTQGSPRPGRADRAARPASRRARWPTSRPRRAAYAAPRGRRRTDRRLAAAVAARPTPRRGLPDFEQRTAGRRPPPRRPGPRHRRGTGTAGPYRTGPARGLAAVTYDEAEPAFARALAERAGLPADDLRPAVWAAMFNGAACGGRNYAWHTADTSADPRRRQAEPACASDCCPGGGGRPHLTHPHHAGGVAEERISPPPPRAPGRSGWTVRYGRTFRTARPSGRKYASAAAASTGRQVGARRGRHDRGRALDEGRPPDGCSRGVRRPRLGSALTVSTALPRSVRTATPAPRSTDAAAAGPPARAGPEPAGGGPARRRDRHRHATARQRLRQFGHGRGDLGAVRHQHDPDQLLLTHRPPPPAPRRAVPPRSPRGPGARCCAPRR